MGNMCKHTNQEIEFPKKQWLMNSVNIKKREYLNNFQEPTQQSIYSF